MKLRDWWRRRRHWVQNPVVTLVLLVLVTVDAADQLIGNPNYFRFAPLTAYVVSEDAGWRIIDPDVESFDELGDMLVGQPESLIRAAVTRVNETSGLWGETSRRTGAELALQPMGGQSISQGERADIRAALIGFLESRGWDAEARLIQEEESVRRQVLWSGYIHNAISLAALAVLLYSLGWIPRTPAWFRERRAAAAIARGKCPTCGYTITNLDQCPECGRTIHQ